LEAAQILFTINDLDGGAHTWNQDSRLPRRFNQPIQRKTAKFQWEFFRPSSRPRVVNCEQRQPLSSGREIAAWLFQDAGDLPRSLQGCRGCSGALLG